MDTTVQICTLPLSNTPPRALMQAQNKGGGNVTGNRSVTGEGKAKLDSFNLSPMVVSRWRDTQEKDKGNQYGSNRTVTAAKLDTFNLSSKVVSRWWDANKDKGRPETEKVDRSVKLSAFNLSPMVVSRWRQQ